MLYIVSSGDGYFVKFVNGSPMMDTDPVCATRMEEAEAEGVIDQLDEMGFAGDLIGLRFGKMRYYCKQCGVEIVGENAYSTYGVAGVFCSSPCVDKYSDTWLRRLARWAGHT